MFVGNLNAKCAKSVSQSVFLLFVCISFIDSERAGCVYAAVVNEMKTVGYKMWSPRNGEKTIATV